MEEIRALARDILSLAVAATGILVAVGFAANFLEQQAYILTGNSYGLSRVWVRIIGLVAGFLIVVFAPTVSQWVIETLAGMGL